MANKIYKLAISAGFDCVRNLRIDGKEVEQSPSLWMTMMRNASRTETPTCTVEFDFVWSNEARRSWAGKIIVEAFRKWLISTKRVFKTQTVGKRI